MTSSRRHFVKIKSLSYLHNGRSLLNQIGHDESQFYSGQVHVHKRVRTSTRQCARENSKWSKSSKIHFAYVLGHSHHLTKNRAHADTRVFSVRTPYKGKHHAFPHCLGV